MKILLIADVCNDVYHYGNVDRISPEAPVPVFEPYNIEVKGGMGYNVESNLKSLGVDVTSIFGIPSIKERYIDEKSKHQLLRVDVDVKSDPLKELPEDRNKYDCIVISDYNKGLLTPGFLQYIIDNTSVPVFLDTKKTDVSNFNCFIKINKNEFDKISSPHARIIVTLGSGGALYKGKIYPTEPVPVYDVCGAGDTFLAALAYKFTMTKDMEKAIIFANKAASITVQKLGVYAPTLEEIGND